MWYSMVVDRNDLAPNIKSSLSNVCSSKVECCLRGRCAGRGLELFWTIQMVLSVTAAILANFLQILAEGLLLLQLKLDSPLWYSACLHFMMPEIPCSVDHDDYYAASTHLFGDLYEIFICSIKLFWSICTWEFQVEEFRKVWNMGKSVKFSARYLN